MLTLLLLKHRFNNCIKYNKYAFTDNFIILKQNINWNTFIL